MAHTVPAIFLDRDGTINVDHGYVHEIDQFQFIDGVIDAMRELKEMGFALVLVTNQSGIARGMFTEEQFDRLTEWMDWSLADRGVDLDGIYYCPHHPDGSVDAFRQQCDCRKPQPGMLISARDYLHIDMDASYMVGDKLEDMLKFDDREGWNEYKAAYENKVLDIFKATWREKDVYPYNIIDNIKEYNKNESYILKQLYWHLVLMLLF